LTFPASHFNYYYILFLVLLFTIRMLAVVSLKRSAQFDPLEQAAKRKCSEKIGAALPPSSPPRLPTTFSFSSKNGGENKQQQQQDIVISKLFSSCFPSSSIDQQQQRQIMTPTKKLFKPCSLTALSTQRLSQSSQASSDDLPIFTYSQTVKMCQRALSDNDKLLREQYEKLLNIKLNEQYEKFVRYTHDSFDKQQPQCHQLESFAYFGCKQQQEQQQPPFSYVS